MNELNDNAKENKIKARDLVLEAYEEEKKKNYDQALQALSEALKLDNMQPSWHASQGRFLEKLDRFEEALKSYERAVKICDEPNPSYLRLLGLCAFRIGCDEQAYEALQLAVSSNLKSFKIDAILAELQERLSDPEKKLDRIYKEMSPTYYNYVYSISEENEHHDFDIYFGLWEKIVEKIAQTKCSILLDIGCGPGLFAKFLLSRLPHINYTGIDFSPIAIQFAQQSCPDLTFIEADAFKTPLLKENSFEIIVSTEFLEHVEHDLEILQRFKTKTVFFGSVPNYYAFGHIRYFKTAKEVYDRYASCFKSLSVEDVEIGNDRVLYLLHGIL